MTCPAWWRLTFAATLLRCMRDSPATIADRVGYSTPYAHAHAFVGSSARSRGSTGFQRRGEWQPRQSFVIVGTSARLMTGLSGFRSPSRSPPRGTPVLRSRPHDASTSSRILPLGLFEPMAPFDLFALFVPCFRCVQEATARFSHRRGTGAPLAQEHRVPVVVRGFRLSGRSALPGAIGHRGGRGNDVAGREAFPTAPPARDLRARATAFNRGGALARDTRARPPIHRNGAVGAASRFTPRPSRACARTGPSPA